ncbi:MAG: hypothetical protein ACOCZ8_05580 [Bacteroidota bacterium]
MTGSTFRLLLALAGTAAIGFIAGRIAAQRARVDASLGDANSVQNTAEVPKDDMQQPRMSSGFTGYTFGTGQANEYQGPAKPLAIYNDETTARAAELMDEVDSLLEQLRTKKA